MSDRITLFFPNRLLGVKHEHDYKPLIFFSAISHHPEKPLSQPLVTSYITLFVIRYKCHHCLDILNLPLHVYKQLTAMPVLDMVKSDLV